MNETAQLETPQKLTPLNGRNHSLQIGNILVEQWGYSMCLVTFYQVTGLKGKATVELREIAGRETCQGFLQGRSEPIADSFLPLDHNRKLLTRRVKPAYDGRTCVKIREWGSWAYPHKDGDTYFYDHCD